MDILISVLSILGVVILLVQLITGITFLRRGDGTHGSILYTFFLLFLMISIFLIPYNKALLLILIPLSWLVGTGVGLLVAKISPYASWLTFPITFLTRALFKVFTLGISKRKIWLTSTSNNWAALIRSLGERSESQERRKCYINFINQVITPAFQNLNETDNISLEIFQPSLNLFLIGAFEAHYKKEINTSSKDFDFYTGEFFYCIEMLAKQWALLNIINKKLPSNFSNLYFIHLEKDETLRKSFIKGKDLSNNYNLFVDSPELIYYYRGKEIAFNFINSNSNPQIEFTEILNEWCERSTKTLEDSIEEVIAWNNWR